MPSSPVHHSTKWHADYQWFSGGWVTPRDAAILQACQGGTWGRVRLSQGGLSFGTLSADTHAGLGAFDIAIDGRSKLKVWWLCRRLRRSGVWPFPRGYQKDSFEKNKHLHCVSIESFASLHPSAQRQLTDSRYGGYHGGAGLAGRPALRYSGPFTPRGTWSSSPYNPANIRRGRFTYYVVAKELLGLDVDRQRKYTRKRGFKVTGHQLVRRWGRWNLVTDYGTYYAIADSRGTYLSTKNPK
jgi:hypothetical protein